MWDLIPYPIPHHLSINRREHERQKMNEKYRVVKTEIDYFVTPAQVKTAIVWEGTDTISLSRKYPPSNIHGADDLGLHFIEDGYITWFHHFEKLVGGVWVECPDPRVRLTVGLTDLEQELVQESRRLFPGDYDLDEMNDEEDYFDDESGKN